METRVKHTRTIKRWVLGALYGALVGLIAFGAYLGLIVRIVENPLSSGGSLAFLVVGTGVSALIGAFVGYAAKGRRESGWSIGCLGGVVAGLAVIGVLVRPPINDLVSALAVGAGVFGTIGFFTGVLISASTIGRDSG